MTKRIWPRSIGFIRSIGDIFYSNARAQFFCFNDMSPFIRKLKLGKIESPHKNSTDTWKTSRDNSMTTSNVSIPNEMEETASCPTQTEERQYSIQSRSSMSPTKQRPVNIFLLFNISETENILGMWSCALEGNNFTRGTLVLLNHFLVFYTRVMHHTLGFCIPLEYVTHIEPVNAGILFHKAVKVTIEGEKPLIFTSLASRDDAYQQIFVLWNLFRLGKSNDLTDASGLNLTVLKRVYSENKVASPKISMTLPSEDTSTPLSKEEQERDLTANTIFPLRFEDNAHLVTYQKLPISAIEFGEILASGQSATQSCVSSKFHCGESTTDSKYSKTSLDAQCRTIFEEFHRLRSHQGLELGEWQRSDRLGCSRVITYHMPINHSFVSWLLGANYGRVAEVQRFSLSPDRDKLVIESQLEFLDVACKHCFQLQIRMEVRNNIEESFAEGNIHSIVKVFCRVQWKSRFLLFRSRFESFLKEEVTNSLHVLFQLIRSRWHGIEASNAGETEDSLTTFVSKSTSNEEEECLESSMSKEGNQETRNQIPWFLSHVYLWIIIAILLLFICLLVAVIVGLQRKIQAFPLSRQL